MPNEKVNILMVDDQRGKLLSYEVILEELGENLIKASSGKEALECLLKDEIAIVLMDVSMPDLDGFELAEIPDDCHYFHLRRSHAGHRSAEGLSKRRSRLHFGSCDSRAIASKGQRLCGVVSQNQAIRTAKWRSSPSIESFNYDAR
jgi:hypothetical protein